MKYRLLSFFIALLLLLSGCSAQANTGEAELVCPTSSVAQADCRLCGDADVSLASCYDGQGPIVLLCLNTWVYGEIPLYEYDSAGDPIETPGHFLMSKNVDREHCGWDVAADPDRHTADVTISYGDRSELSFDTLAGQLCQDCLEQVFEAVTAWRGDGEPLRCAVLMDPESGSLYPVASGLVGYYIGDFWVHIEHDREENRDRVYLVYNPIA